MTETPLVLDVSAVARLLGVSRRTVEHLITRGELRSFRIGRMRRVRRIDLEDYLARRVDAEQDADDVQVERLSVEAMRLIHPRQRATAGRAGIRAAVLQEERHDHAQPAPQA